MSEASTQTTSQDTVPSMDLATRLEVHVTALKKQTHLLRLARKKEREAWRTVAIAVTEARMLAEQLRITKKILSTMTGIPSGELEYVRPHFDELTCPNCRKNFTPSIYTILPGEIRDR